jgi:prolyl oligopeptidase
MPRLLSRRLVAALCLWPAGLGAQQLSYPPSDPGTVVEDYAGHQVADPYRWMEDLNSPATKHWVEAQNAVTFGYLANLPQREAIRQRLTKLWNYPKVQVPVREAGQLFFRRNTGLEKQSVLYRQRGPTDEPQAVLDPNSLSPDGSLAVAGWSVSPDGRYLAYTTAEGGSDMRDIHIRDLRTGKDLAETVLRVKFTDISWTRDSRGFLYSRFKGSREAANLQDANTFHQSWYHRIGAADERLEFDRPDNPGDGVATWTSDDGRWLFASAGSGTSNNRLWMADLGQPRRPHLSARFRVVAPEEDAIHNPLGVVGRTLYLYTTFQAPRGRIVGVTLGDTTRARWRDVVPEGPYVIDAALLVGSRIVVTSRGCAEQAQAVRPARRAERRSAAA